MHTSRLSARCGSYLDKRRRSHSCKRRFAFGIGPSVGRFRLCGQPSDERITRLLQADLLANLLPMSTVELAVRKVKKLSARQARELLGWLAARQANGTSLKQPSRILRRNTTARRSMQKLKAWQDSVRFTTDWQPPRMPDDVVKPVRL